MRRHLLFIIALISFTLLHSCGLIDDREKKAKDFLEQKITSQSGNALKLESFKKTNGGDQELAGVKLYNLEWEALVSVQKEAWRDNDGTWSDFKVRTTAPNKHGWYLLPQQHLSLGTKISLKGESIFAKTDNGWQTDGDGYHVSSWKILNNDSTAAK